MTEPSSESTSSTPSLPAPPPEGLAARIFLGPDGLRVGWSLLLYGAFAFIIWYLQLVILLIAGFGGGTFSPQSVTLGDLVSFAAAYGAALLMSRLERRPADVYGLPLPEAFGKSFWLGIFLGLCEVSLLVGLIAAFGGYSFGD